MSFDQFPLNEKNFNQFKKKFGLESNNIDKIIFTKNKNKINVTVNNSLIGEIIGNNCPLLNIIENTTIFNKNNSYHTKSIHQMSKIIEHLSNINTIYFKDNKEKISRELIYEGELENGKVSGVGKIITYKGNNIENIYKGEFKNGEPYGLGEFKFGNNNIYKGEFKSNETCIGYMKGKNFEYYGEFKNLMFNGRGILYEINKKLEGTFKEGYFLNFTDIDTIKPSVEKILINVDKIVSSIK